MGCSPAKDGASGTPSKGTRAIQHGCRGLRRAPGLPAIPCQSNYGSIREEVTLDLRIPGTAPDLTCFRRSAAKPGVRLPAVGVLMGPNGSGKSTLLRALVDALRIGVTVNYVIPIRIVPFLSEPTRWEPTRFCLEGEWDLLSRGDGPDSA